MILHVNMQIFLLLSIKKEKRNLSFFSPLPQAPAQIVALGIFPRAIAKGPTSTAFTAVSAVCPRIQLLSPPEAWNRSFQGHWGSLDLYTRTFSSLFTFIKVSGSGHLCPETLLIHLVNEYHQASISWFWKARDESLSSYLGARQLVNKQSPW